MRRAVVGVAFLVSMVFAGRAEAAIHLVKIVEVFPGSPAHPNAQYVVIQMYAGGQTISSGSNVRIFNAAGTQLSMTPFTTNAVNGANQDRYLVATAEAQALFGITADLTIPATIPKAGGRICFETYDCVGWGSYAPVAGDQVTSPWNGAPAEGLVLGRAIARRLGANMTLENADDTDNSNNDFVLALPAPRNNARATGTIPAATCGANGVEGIERCDDGNTTAMDGCSATCEPEVCGDALVNRTGETCDDGNATSGDGCDTNCTITACGNAVVTTGEMCDDGNATSGDGCDTNCTTTACGNGVATTGEICDDGNLTSGDGCDGNCTVTGCGNGVVTMGEACDPPNGGSCSATCQQQCVTNPDCVDADLCTVNETCNLNSCSNTPAVTEDNNPCTMDGCVAATGVFHTALPDGMTCVQSGGAAGLCITGACAAPSCGDGFLDVGVEACDDGNAIDDDACTNACTAPACGDMIVQAGEECDDGNATANDGCTEQCVTERCGDGVIQSTEECDDANTSPEDGCGATCRNERCGDGVPQITEDCDDGNDRNDDACTTLCTAPRCGDGLVSGGETCDDGNTTADDDCDMCATPTVPGDGGGCCEASPNGASTALLGFFGIALVLRRRRR